MDHDDRSQDALRTPANQPRRQPLRSAAVKRDSLAAELERDPQYSTAKRQQRTQIFANSVSHASLERQLLAAQTARVELETKLREKELLVERLERDRRYFADREREEREEREREQQEREDEKHKTDSDLRALRTELSTLREEHADLQDQNSALSRSTTQTIASQKSLITSLTHRVSILEQDLSETRTLADTRQTALQDVQEQLEELNSTQAALAHHTADEENMTIVREELHRQADYLRQLESTNARLSSEVTILRERQTSAEVLREKNRSLEAKLQTTNELRQKNIRLEAELEAARREREEWASRTDTPTTPSKTPISITQTLSDIRLAHARLLEDHGATMASLRQRESEYADLERRYSESVQATDKLQADIRSMEERAQRRDVQLRLADREVGFLQALVASFNAEEAHMDNATIDATKVQRIEYLETLLEDYKSTNTLLIEEVDNLKSQSAFLAPSADLERERQEKLILQQALEEAQKESTSALDKVETLEQELFELSGEIAGGRHVPPNMRVLSLRDNPEQQWFDLRQQTLDRLKSENDALLKRLHELESSGARPSPQREQADGELVPRESYDIITREKTELEELVQQKEKRLLRLQQIFTSKSAEFREAIASILGVKLAFYPNGQVKVTSMFDLNASFVFQPPADKSRGEGAMTMQLIAQGEGGPQDLPSIMRYWIENEQCIPGFMASVTLECYEKRKQAGGEDSGQGF